MFNMSNIGLKIAKMRKDAQITQMGLADRLNISYQAVSSWERGQTMPDIAKLHELSEIFGVSIDELLENKRGAEIISAAESGTMPEAMPTIEEVAEIGAILTAKQNDSIVEKIIEEKKEKGEIMNLKEIASAAPFISTKLLDEIAEKAISESGGDISVIKPIAPFVSTGFIDRIACKIMEETGSLKGVSSLAPFISTEVIDKYAEKLVNENKNLNVLSPLAPFISTRMIDSLASKMLNEKGFDAVSPIMPFISENIIEDYIRSRYL